MIRPRVNLEKHAYKLSDITFIYSDDDQVTIPATLVKSLIINNDYENNITSSYMMGLTIQKNNYEKLITNIDTVTASFTLSRNFIGYVDGGGESDKYNDTANIQDNQYAVFNLKVLNDNNLSTVDANRLPKSETANTVKSDAADYTQDLIPLTLYMYDAKRLDKYKVNQSLIVDGGLNDCIYQLFKQRGFTDLLIDPVSNNIGKTYAVPYGNLGFNLSSINEYYGIYNYPYLFFMDPKRNYLINKGNLGKCLEKGEMGTVNIYLEKLEEGASAVQSGCYCDEENKIYVLDAKEFNIVDNDSAIDYIAGGKITTVIRGTGEIKHDTIGDYDIEKTYVVNNDCQHSQLIYQIKESKRSVGLVFADVDISIFTPNKSFVIIPDDTYYSKDYNINGKYRLTSSSIVLQSQTEGLFKSGVQIMLNKVS